MHLFVKTSSATDCAVETNQHHNTHTLSTYIVHARIYSTWRKYTSSQIHTVSFKHLQGVVFLLEYLLPQTVGTALHDGLCHGLIAAAPALPILTASRTPRIVEHHLKQPVRHALQKLSIDVRLVKQDVCLTRIHTQSLHECLLVLLSGRDSRELEENDAIQRTKEFPQRENVWLFQCLLDQGNDEVVDTDAGLLVHPPPQLVDEAAAEHAETRHGPSEDVRSRGTEDDRDVFVADLEVLDDAVQNQGLVLLLYVLGGGRGTRGKNEFQNLTDGFLIPHCEVSTGKAVHGDGPQQLHNAAHRHVLLPQYGRVGVLLGLPAGEIRHHHHKL